MKKWVSILAVVLMTLPTATVLAQTEVEVAASGVSWFFLLEVIGVIICLATLVIVLTMIRFLPPAQVLFFKYLAVSLMMIAGSLVMRSGFELLELEGELYQEVFEVSLYIGLFVLFVGSYVSLKKIYYERSIR